MLLPAGGAVTGWAALNLARAAYFDGLLPDGRTEMPVALVAGPGHSRRPRPGIRWLQDRMDPNETCDRFGTRCARVIRAVVDEMRVRGLRHAVEAMDMVAAAA